MNEIMNIIENAKNVFDTEIIALQKTKDSIDETFSEIIKLIRNCTGKVIITGMGKPGHVATKIAATFSSLGIPAFFLHPGEAMHGDLGMISSNDLVLVISYSGESNEIIAILHNIKIIGAKIVAITGNINSTLAKLSDIVQVLPKFKEACHLGLAPTSSTTVAMCYCDALAVVSSQLNGFTESDFAKFHPAGSLGKKLLLKVENLMVDYSHTAIVDKNIILGEAIIEMSKKNLTIVTAVENNKIAGIITDGDLRRLLERKVDLYSIRMKDVMTKKPYIIKKDEFAIQALNVMRNNNFSAMPVIDSKGNYNGIITIFNINKAGIV